MASIGSAPALPIAPPLAGTGTSAPVDAEAAYEAHFDFVWRNARRLGVREGDIDDVVQEVFIVVHRRGATFEARASMQTWLFGILIRVVQHYRRSKARMHNKLGALVELGEDAEPRAPEGPHEALSTREKAALLHRLLSELDEEKRAVFILVELEEQSVPDVAEALGVNVNTVYSRLRAARIEIEKAIARERARESRMAEP